MQDRYFLLRITWGILIQTLAPAALIENSRVFV